MAVQMSEQLSLGYYPWYISDHDIPFPIADMAYGKQESMTAVSDVIDKMAAKMAATQAKM